MFSLYDTNYKQFFIKEYLPDSFYEEMIDYEFKLSKGSINLKDIKHLLFLYSVAVEYFEKKSNNKYLDFQNKINDLLSDPMVIDIISKSDFSNIEKEYTLFEKEKINYKENNSNNHLIDKTNDTSQENIDVLCTIFNNDYSSTSSKSITNSFNYPKERVKRTMEYLKNNINHYLKEYHVHFNKTNFNHFQSKVKEILSEKYKKLILIKESYMSHIKEIDLISSNDDNHTHLKEIIDSLKQEQINELNKLESFYDKVIEDFYSNWNYVSSDLNGFSSLLIKLKNTLSTVIEMKSK